MCSLLVALAVPLLLAVSEAADDRTRTFNAPADRVWTVTRSTLTSLGWKIDKEDRDAARTEVSVERRVFTEERILFVDKEEDILTTARSVEKKLLDEVARHL
jgi:hypothetical protein